MEIYRFSSSGGNTLDEFKCNFLLLTQRFTNFASVILLFNVSAINFRWNILNGKKYFNSMNFKRFSYQVELILNCIIVH